MWSTISNTRAANTGGVRGLCWEFFPVGLSVAGSAQMGMFKGPRRRRF
jgi:hypothetical protein